MAVSFLVLLLLAWIATVAPAIGIIAGLYLIAAEGMVLAGLALIVWSIVWDESKDQQTKG